MSNVLLFFLGILLCIVAFIRATVPTKIEPSTVAAAFGPPVIAQTFKEAPKIAVIYLRSWWAENNTIGRNYWFCVVGNVPELESGKIERPSIVTGYFESPEAWRAANDAAWRAFAAGEQKP